MVATPAPDDEDVETQDLLSAVKTYYDSAGRVQFTVELFAREAVIGRPEFKDKRIADLADPDFRYGLITESVYDSLGRLEESIQYLSGQFNEAAQVVENVAEGDRLVTRYEYDAAGRQVKVTDALGHHTWTTYDGVGRVIETKFDDGSVIRTEYDEFGRRSAETAQYDPGAPQLDMVNVTTRYDYWPSGQLKAVELPPVEHPDNGNMVHPRYEYEYDKYGNQTAIIDNQYIVVGTTDVNSADARRTEFTYDQLHRQTSRTLPLGVGGSGFQEEFDYLDVQTNGSLTAQYQRVSVKGVRYLCG